MRVLHVLTCTLAMALATSAFATSANSTDRSMKAQNNALMFHVEHVVFTSAKTPVDFAVLPDPLLPSSFGFIAQPASTQEAPNGVPSASVRAGVPLYQANHGMLKVAWRS